MEKRKYSEELTFAASQYGKEKEYWLAKLSGELVKSCFPYDYKKSKESDYKTGFVKIDVPAEHISRLLVLSKGLDHRIHMILAAGVVVLLSKYSGNDDILVGVPIYKQDIKGDFLNTVLVIRNQLNKNMTFKELLLHDVRQAVIEANENQNYPLETLLYQLGFSFSGSEFPLFDVVILLENIHDKKYIRHIYPNITFSFLRTGEYLEGVLEYNPELYHRATVERIARHFISLLEKVIFNTDIALSAVDILSPVEKRQLLSEFNNTKTEYPDEMTIDALFEEQVEKAADRLALICGENCLSYGELNDRANSIAWYLQGRGVRLEEAVGIMAEQSEEMVLGILGILKAGGAYLPVNIEYPGKRKEYLLNNGNVRVLLTNYEEEDIENYVPEVMNISRFELDKTVGNPVRFHQYDNLAYIMYTSGSSGNPKGIMVEHRNVVRLVKNTNFVEFREGDRVLQTGPLEFDASTFEIWGPLLNGLQLGVVSKDTILTQEELKATIRKNKITTMWMTSALFNQVLDIDIEIFYGIKNLLIGGDVLSPTHINRLRNQFPGLSIINGYGPTENTTFSTTYLLRKEHQESIPIGKPISNSTAYIVDKNINLLPIGIPGELCVGGDGVTRGYLNNFELTDAKFLRNPFTKRGHIYKTGDYVRMLADGNIEFLGRIDQQVKIRGYRIEPKEVENCLIKIGSITDAVVLDRKNKLAEKHLCAYFVSREDVNISELRSILMKMLPDYMIPSYFVQLGSLPLTANGKLDRAALPEPEIKAEEYIAPRDNIEKTLVTIWSEVLNIDREKIGVNSNFFELGGHSLKATTLVSKIHKELNVRIPIVEVFEKQTLNELSGYIKSLPAVKYAAVKPTCKKEYYPLSTVQMRVYIVQQMYPDSVSFNSYKSFYMNGVVNKEELENTFRELIQRHDSLRTSFRMVNEEPVQVIHDMVDFRMDIYEGIEDIEIQKDIYNFIKPFELSKAPLFRVSVIHTGRNNVVLIDMHHIICDGTSLEVLQKEFLLLYEDKKLPELRLQYKDYIAWQNSEEYQKIVSRQEEYWLGVFPGDFPVLDLPTDFERPAMKSYEGAAVNFMLSKKETSILKDISKEADATLFMTILAVFNILFSKLCGKEDITLGIAVEGRRHADLKNIMGMFVNLLPIRSFVDRRKTIKEFLKDVKKRVLDTYENQEYQFDNLLEKIAVRQDNSRHPMFDVVLNLLNQYETNINIDESNEDGTFRHVVGISQYDMTVTAVDLGERILLSLRYCTRLFKPGTIERFLKYFRNILASLSVTMSIKLCDVNIITAEEQAKYLNINPISREVKRR